ncbi:hypothetical protein AOQ84DRAFT_426668 [Glonium stellatum]|uniref:Uncharacterized protein n=1 Tax=Glonium stellatum TaxID=574774 RepID=A0A8E2EN51_9PEZI|nr:hypothetical protein AOQ84DRAFT_426668 [Glonium stellatum]
MCGLWVRDIEEYKAEVIDGAGRKEGLYYNPPNGSEYWKQRVPREVTHVNVSVNDQRLRRADDCKLYAVYSDTLNKWMLRALLIEEKYRITSHRLVKKMIPVGEEMIRGFAGKAGLIDLEISCEEREESDDEEDIGANEYAGLGTDDEAEADMDNTSDYSP